MPEQTQVIDQQPAPSLDYAPGEIILNAEHITKIFPGTVALDDVMFNVRNGQVNVLIGENGAGKSTLMKILAGVERPSSGKILLDGKEITRVSVSFTRNSICAPT